ncbi:hypothetical protein L596_018139 [Steinernema carpocapsae]|uniref:NTR domain-containing protein n=1 Tax=Steinernema carpocapsae TaxID=34508 RepID=A0A4U5N3R7_STECR|nr:hypothetical protein L596_018139 [Steinernema carpocapsae]
MLRSLLLLFAFLAVSFGCSCRCVGGPKDVFCKADVVGVFGIFQELPSNLTSGSRVYFGVSLNVFKFFDETSPQQHMPIFIQTPTHSCGIDWIKEGASYLFNGAYDEKAGYLTVIDCCNISPRTVQWKDVPSDIKNALETGAYKQCPKKSLA